ncbi:MAG: Yip1 family protein [Betaproteobacteria bacterium]
MATDGGAPAVGLVARVRGILLSPSAEWPVIAAEPSSASTIYLRFVVPLAAIGVIAWFIGRTTIGVDVPLLGQVRTDAVAGIGAAVLGYLLSLVSVFVVAWLVNLLAPRFGGQRNSLRALKVTAYSFTPAWVAGVLYLLPALDVLALVAGLYGLYLLYVGLPVLMRCPDDKAPGYTIAPALCAIVLAFVGIFAAKADTDKTRISEGSSKLQQRSQQAGSGAFTLPATDADMTAALSAVGTIVSAGKDIQAVDFRKLRDMLPETLAGMKRTDATAQSGEAMGIKGSSATARYTDGAGASMNVDIADMGSLSGLAGLASRFDPSMEKETETGYERTSKISGQIVHERYDRRAKSGEISIILAERFNVAVRGNGVDAAALQSAIKQIDLAGIVALAK